MELVDENALPMPDDLEPEGESPYLRGKKLVPVRRNRFSRRLRTTLFVLVVLLPVAFAGYELATFALTSSLFVVASPEDVIVTGNHYVSRDEALGVLELPLTRDLNAGTNVFHISLDVLRRRVETLPWVRNATVTRILPRGLLVHITERTPIAYADTGGRVSLIDEDGMLLEKPYSGAFDFPVVYGLERTPSMEERRPRLALYRNFMQQLGVEAPQAGWMISEVYLTDAEDLKALLICGQQTVQVHFGDRDFLEEFRRFLAALPEMQKSNGKLDSVDLRYRNQVVVDPGASEPAPKPAASAGGDRKE